MSALQIVARTIDHPVTVAADGISVTLHSAVIETGEVVDLPATDNILMASFLYWDRATAGYVSSNHRRDDASLVLIQTFCGASRC